MVGAIGGKHINVKYINGGSGAKCWSGLFESLASDFTRTAGLHSMGGYVAKI